METRMTDVLAANTEETVSPTKTQRYMLYTEGIGNHDAMIPTLFLSYFSFQYLSWSVNNDNKWLLRQYSSEV